MYKDFYSIFKKQFDKKKKFQSIQSELFESSSW